jgi:hypothetical protein
VRPWPLHDGKKPTGVFEPVSRRNRRTADPDRPACRALTRNIRTPLVCAVALREVITHSGMTDTIKVIDR